MGIHWARLARGRSERSIEATASAAARPGDTFSSQKTALLIQKKLRNLIAPIIENGAWSNTGENPAADPGRAEEMGPTQKKFQPMIRPSENAMAPNQNSRPIL